MPYVPESVRTPSTAAVISDEYTTASSSGSTTVSSMSCVVFTSLTNKVSVMSSNFGLSFTSLTSTFNVLVVASLNWSATVTFRVRAAEPSGCSTFSKSTPPFNVRIPVSSSMLNLSKSVSSSSTILKVCPPVSGSGSASPTAALKSVTTSFPTLTLSVLVSFKGWESLLLVNLNTTAVGARFLLRSWRVSSTSSSLLSVKSVFARFSSIAAFFRAASSSPAASAAAFTSLTTSFNCTFNAATALKVS